MKKIAGLIILTLIFSCSTSKVTETQNPEPSFESKKVVNIVESDLGHKIEVQFDYKLNIKQRNIQDCKVGFILKNIGDKDLPYGWWLSDKEREMMNIDKNSPPSRYTPDILFELLTSDGGIIEIQEPLFKNLSIGKSSLPRELNLSVSKIGDRQRVEIKATKIVNQHN
ncbi:MAG: hypothetical protein ACK5MD_07985 [Flavobacteriales bacterium]